MAQENTTDTQPEVEPELRFGPFCLEAATRLWRADRPVYLRPRSLALLRYLAERSGQLVTREELLKQLWPGIYVSSTVVKVCVREIRHALGDDATQPQFIETVGMQGYRFRGQVVSSQYPVGSRQKAGGDHQSLEAPTEQLTTGNWQLATHFVGREYELTQLQDTYEHVQQGERHGIFVCGEAGIGKTTLVERFLTQVQARGAVRIGRGYCVEQYEPGEAYLPVLQALQHVCHAPDGDHVVTVLRRYAPLWLVQLAGVIAADDLETIQRQVQGSSPQHMLREFAEAIERLATETPFILFLEDLQWSDSATLELWEYLAQRQEPARLLVIGTYRPADTVARSHSLRRVVQKLMGRRQCHELALELWTEEEVGTYLTRQLAGSPVAAALRSVMCRRTGGNALFVVHFVDHLIQQGLLVETGDQWELGVKPATLEDLIPDHVQQLIVRQIEGLSTEVQQLLEVASVVGMTFTASEVAGIVNHTLEAVETVYDDLANQGQLIEVQRLAEWPDGSITVRYRFRHALYQHVLYHRIGLARRVRWHRQLGEHFATVYGERVHEIAGEVAVHFEQGRDYQRAVLYRQQAGEQALRQSGYERALGHGQAGLALLTQLPTTAERRPLELKLRQLVSAGLAVTQGFADDGLEENLQRAQQLCRELEDDPAIVSVVIGLARLQLYRANRPALAELAQQEGRLTERLDEPLLLVQLHTQLMAIETARGLHTRAEEHYQHVLGYYDPQAHRSLPAFLVEDPLVVAFTASGLSVSLAGWLEQGWSRIAQGLTRAEEAGQYLVLANGLGLAVLVKSLRGEREEAWQLAQKMAALTRAHDFSLHARLGVLLQGGMAVQCGALEEGIAAIISGLAQYRAMGAQLFIPYVLSLLADGYRQQGKVAEALQVVGEALSLTTTNFDVFWEAELYRLKGELLLNAERGTMNDERKTKKKGRASSPIHHSSFIIHHSAEAEACFLSAIEIARKQQAKLLELRAVMSLARLWQQQGRQEAAQQQLTDIYHWFTEGFDTADLQEAKALLEELERATTLPGSQK